MSRNWLVAVGLGAGLAVAGCQWLIWYYAPVEQTLGPVQKIFYTHLPLAWWALISFFGVFVCSIAYLKTKGERWDHLAGAMAEVGVLFATLALLTGSIWARKSWNTWWTWDPRLTTTLVMWFIYAGYLLVRSMDLDRRRQATVCAVVGIVAFLDVPLVFYSARLWRSIHPAVFAKGGGLEPEMKLTAMVCVAAWSLMWLALTGLRFRQMRQRSQLEARIRDSVA